MRLRFFFVLGVIFLVLLGWKWLGQAWDWAVIRWTGADPQASAVSPDTEYFCPMCPGVLSSWPEKCPVCKMPLVRRKRGESTLLPEGVVARMQISPYRMQLAGIRTEAIRYQTLLREWTSLGKVETDSAGAVIVCQLARGDADFVIAGQAVEVILTDGPPPESIAGRVIGVERPRESAHGTAAARIAVPSLASLPAETEVVKVRWQTRLAEVEPYRSLPRNPRPITDADLRDVYRCPDHPIYLYTAPGKCPFDGLTLEHRGLAEHQRVAWTCAAHPQHTAAHFDTCSQCDGLPLTPEVVSYAPDGQVLALPESALIDTGELQVVYVETGPGMFDAVPVRIGARCGDWYAVLGGLELGQRVAAAGAFLLDAETRLNPGLAAGYFGAGSGGNTSSTIRTAASVDKAGGAFDQFELPPGDLARVLRQQVCPVTKLPLGSMGSPIPLRVGEHLVYLCCSGCKSRVAGAEPPPSPQGGSQ
jgi:hypothetical protein